MLRLVAKKQPIFRIRFMNAGKIFELYAKQVTQGELFGFVEISGLLWGKKSDLIVDPTEQDLKNEFAGVSRIHVPMHSVVRVDEVDKSAGGKIISLKGGDEATAASPMIPIYTPGEPGPKN